MGGNTFSTLDIKAEAFSDLEFKEFLIYVRDKLDDVRKDRDEFYRGLRERSTRWVNSSRTFLALSGAAALFLTAIAAGLRFMPKESLGKWEGSDRWFLFAALVIYAIMGAMALYEKGTDKSTAYFRHLTVSLGIRDLWNKFQLATLKEYSELKAAADQLTSRRRICELAEAFCNDLDKLTTGELTDWRAEFLTSLSELEETAKKGTGEIDTRLEKLAEAATKAAEQARAAAERVEAATKPGHLNVTIDGQFDHEVAVFVDGTEKARSTAKKIALDQISTGTHKISAKAKKGENVLEASEMVDVKPGIQSHSITLS